MSDFLSREIDRLLKRLDNEYETSEVRFSLTLNTLDNRRVEYIRRKLGLSKQDLLSNIITAAITDMEIKMGLTKLGNNGEAIFTDEYIDIITSKRPISRYFKDQNT